MSGRARALLISAIAVVTLGVLFASGSAGSAQTFEGAWSIYERQDAQTFVAGGNAVLTGNPLPGHEIVGMGAVGVTTSLDDYQYWGLSHDPVQLPILTCSASISQPVMSLTVVGAYPYAGCVFFLGVTNTGTSDLTIELGKPGSDVPISCRPGACSGEYLDVLAGGNSPAEIAELCRAFGGPANGNPNSGILHAGGNSFEYTISPGYTFVCPIFLVVQQPACENCEYQIEIATPTITPADQILITEITATPTQRTATPTSVNPTATTGSGSPTPTSVPTGSVTPTPVETSAGVRTPGPGTPTPPAGATAVPTPRAPQTGTGVLVRRGQSGEPPSVVPIVLLSLATILCLVIAWPAGRRRYSASHAMTEAAGGATPAETPWSACRRAAGNLIRRIR